MLTILCIATYFKGEAFLRECKAQGCTVLLLTTDKLIGAEWPRDAIDEIHSVPRDASDQAIRRHVDKVARRHRIDRIAALDDFDVEIGAMLREHLRVPGMGRTTASRFRDKLAMRMQARTLGVPVPEFSAVFNDRDVAEWAARVTPPWVLKPRSSAAALGIKKAADRDALWRALDDAGGERAEMLVEQFVPGDVYHVDSIVWGERVVFAVAFKYGRPPMEVSHQGGIFITRRLPDSSDEARAVLEMNRTLQEGLGLRRGVSHTEFIRAGGAGEAGGAADAGRVVFLETSARVGGAFIVDTIEAATGINLWREWAKVEIAGETGTYTVPPYRDEYAGIVLTLARQETPDMSSYTDPEIAMTIRKDHHAGIIVSSPAAARVEALIGAYTQRFYRDFFATQPPPERPVE
ncbi:MAG: argininosuccinate lyase [Acidobacteria bacterium]|nr:argininosuccinate lyase [Acidobacteriota bacterium]